MPGSLAAIGSFLSSPDKTVGAALVLAAIAGIGWIIARAIAAGEERRRQELIWQLDHTASQLKDLYGPLAFLLTEGRQTFSDLVDGFGRNYVFGKDPLPADEFATWIFWAEQDLMPRNRAIRELLAGHAHLIEGDALPQSFADFLSHQSSWELAHRRWQMEKVPYSWHSRVDWPAQFEVDVLTGFGILKARHEQLMGRLYGGSPGSRPHK